MYNDNIVIKFFNKATDLMVLNLLFLLCSLPVVTIGASLSAMYAVNLRSVRYGDGYVAKVFFKSFKESFFQATVAWILFCLCAVILFFDYHFWLQAGSSGMAKYMQISSLVLAIILGVIFLWLFPVIAKMKDSFFRQVKNAAAMAFGHFLPHTAICLVLAVGSAYAVYRSFAAMLVFVLVGFAVITYAQSFFFYQVFAKYITEAPASEEDPLYSGKNAEKIERTKKE